MFQRELVTLTLGLVALVSCTHPTGAVSLTEGNIGSTDVCKQPNVTCTRLGKGETAPLISSQGQQFNVDFEKVEAVTAGDSRVDYAVNVSVDIVGADQSEKVAALIVNQCYEKTAASPNLYRDADQNFQLAFSSYFRDASNSIPYLRSGGISSMMLGFARVNGQTKSCTQQLVVEINGVRQMDPLNGTQYFNFNMATVVLK